MENRQDWRSVRAENLVEIALYGHGSSAAQAQAELRRRLESEEDAARKLLVGMKIGL